MSPKIEELFDSIEKQKQNLLLSLINFSNERLHMEPIGKWSLLQILNHIITAERLSVMYLQKKIQGIDEVDSSGFVEELKMILLIISQRIPGLKFKAPRMVVEMTPALADIHSISKDWENVRADLKSLLEKIPKGKEKKLIYKHVRAGRLNVIHALKFFREHLIHHMPQIKRLM